MQTNYRYRNLLNRLQKSIPLERKNYVRIFRCSHEAEVHFHSLEPASDTANPKDVVSELKERYDEGKVREEIGPNCGKKFQCFSKGVFEGAHGMLQGYSDDNVFCHNCQKYEFN